MRRMSDSGRGSGRNRPLLGVVLVGALAMVTACASGSYETGNQDTGGAGGTLTVALPSDIISMDPAMHRSRVTQSVVRNVFDALVNQGPDLQPVPELATSWQQLDPTTWQFDLRRDVTFHNGEPFDAEAVKFSIERLLDPDQKSPRASMLSSISSVEVKDPHTVLIKTKTPSPILLAGLAVNEIVPPKYVQEVGAEEFAKKPVGTGPFSFVERVPNERIVLQANKDYWGGAPKVDKLVFRPVPEVSARIAALKSGEVHIAAEIPADLAPTLTGDVKAAPVTGTRIFFLAMNVTQAPFTSAEVRAGVNHAIDREALVKGLYQGYGRSLDQPACPEMLGYHDSFQGPSFDLAKAKQLLSAADGAAVRIDVEEKDKTLAEAVAGQLQQAGLKATVNVLETQAFTNSIGSGASQAYLSSWGVAEGDADVIFAQHFWSPSRSSAFYTGYRNDQVDKLVADARATTDQTQREALYRQAIETVMHDAPWAPLLNPHEIYGVSTRVLDWEPSPIGRYNVVKTSLAS